MSAAAWLHLERSVRGPPCRFGFNFSKKTSPGYLGKWCNLTCAYFSRWDGWFNHQLQIDDEMMRWRIQAKLMWWGGISCFSEFLSNLPKFFPRDLFLKKHDQDARWIFFGDHAVDGGYIIRMHHMIPPPSLLVRKPESNLKKLHQKSGQNQQA